MTDRPPVRFAVIGLNHFHVFRQVNVLLDAGAELVSFFAQEPDLASEFSAVHPQARLAESVPEILEDETTDLIVCASIPSERAAIGIAAMRHGKDVMSDKPAFTEFDQLAAARAVQRQTERIYSVFFGERFESPATVKAVELVKAGAIGRVLHTMGLGPHRLNLAKRPDWFYRRARSGGILADIASHQIDQFLEFTGSRSAEIVTARVANYANPHHPEFEDFGEIVLAGEEATGFVRVDWFTPDGLGHWGDGRVIVLGTDGYIEIRKICDIAGRPGGNHLFLVDQKDVRHIDCNDVALPYGSQLVDDIVNRTETAMGQEHCFLACELALAAETRASRLGHLGTADRQDISVS